MPNRKPESNHHIPSANPLWVLLGAWNRPISSVLTASGSTCGSELGIGVPLAWHWWQGMSRRASGCKNLRGYTGSLLTSHKNSPTVICIHSRREGSISGSMFWIRLTDGGDSRKLRRPPQTSLSTHSRQTGAETSPLPPQTMRENANLKGFTTYILRRVLNRPQGRRSVMS